MQKVHSLYLLISVFVSKAYLSLNLPCFKSKGARFFCLSFMCVNVFFIHSLDVERLSSIDSDPFQVYSPKGKANFLNVLDTD